MKFICIVGDSAVGKMTVGQELEKLIGYSLFHNHMSIEIVLDVFKSFHIPAIEAIRKAVIDEFIKTDRPGLIMTLQLPFDVPEEIIYLEEFLDYFDFRGVESFLVELDADLETRLMRNKTENRLFHKASKRDLEASEKRLLKDAANHRCYSLPGEVKHPRFIKIDNTNLSAEETALKIIKHFSL